MSNSILDAIPIPMVMAVLLAVLALAVSLGYKLGLRRLRRGRPEEKVVAHGGAALGAMLALVSFLLAFTYSLAGGQFDARRALVIDDANAIGTTFLRADYLPEPYRSRSRDLLAAYVEDRDQVFEQRTHAQLAEAERLQQELWAQATAVARKHPDPVVATYIQTLNELIDLHAKRAEIEVWVRIPGMVLATLAFLSVLTMTLNGYLLALTAPRFVGATILLIVTYATVFMLVIDLDRPARGFFSVSQQPMINLGDDIKATLGE